MDNFEEILSQIGAVKKVMRGTEENPNPVVFYSVPYTVKNRKVGYVEKPLKTPKRMYKCTEITTPFGIFPSAAQASRDLCIPSSTIAKRIRDGAFGWYRNGD